VAAPRGFARGARSESDSAKPWRQPFWFAPLVIVEKTNEERAVHLDAGETLCAESEPLFLRRVAIEIVAPGFVIPTAGADVRFGGHCFSLRISNLSFAARF
jgi:hypothetical protein